MSIDFGQVARELQLPIELVERTVALLDEGNTVPFITRFRKDQTGGLDESLIRTLQERVEQLRQLRERKEKILRSIEVQGKLTEDLASAIHEAQTAKRLEDLYLPFKPRKQTLATLARERGLEPLAEEALAGTVTVDELQARAAALCDADKSIPTMEDVLDGVGHLVAERFCEHAELRGRLRKLFQQTGRVICTKVEPTEHAAAVMKAGSAVATAGNETTSEEAENTPEDAEEQREEEVGEVEVQVDGASELAAEEATNDVEEAPAADAVEEPLVALESDSPAEKTTEVSTTNVEDPVGEATAETATTVTPAAESTPSSDAAYALDTLPAGRLFEAPAAPIPAPELQVKKKKKKKKKKVSDNAFKDYFDFKEPVNRVPPHRILAINRGEKARSIRVRVEADFDAMLRETEQVLVPAEHPQADFLKSCARDALARLIVPSLEREIRRELTDWAETHAVEVFIRNLRKLMLQPPVRGGRVLAIDPGFKSGCRLIALDEFGQVLGHGVMFVVGKEDRLQKSRQRLAEMVKLHKASFIAIGNGTGSREAEHLVAELLANELKDHEVSYCVVNEAGASIYSTSQLGREELPTFDALQRGAISIGRRLLDPLSELVKINPANIGVGMYQHDVKAKHLKDSLDAVVESCVNFVGVDVNSASPALLRYVSGMNQLTARRVYEYRRDHGPFRTREELKNVPGLGDATFVQAAGFLKVLGGDNPLDATWIHPESYELATKVLGRFGSNLEELAKSVPPPLVPQKKQRTFFGIPLDEATAPPVEASSVVPVAEAATAVEAVSLESAESATQPAETTAMNSTPAIEVPQNVTTEEQSSEAIVPTAVEEGIPTAEEATEATVAIDATEEALPKGPTSSEIAAGIRADFAEKAGKVDIETMARELEVGPHLLHDVIQALIRPGLDPRESLPPPVFRKGVMRLEDLEPGMELSGTVLNVVDFGAFLDIGLTDSGLVHISRLADRFIRDPHEVVSVGDVLKVWVVDVDKGRRRVSLTAIMPGSERLQPQRRERPSRGERAPQSEPQGQTQDGRPAPTAGGNPPPQRGGGRGGPPGGQGGGRDRPPQRGGGRGGNRGGRSNGPPQPQSIERAPTKPKVIKPLTKKMEAGKEPLRSFSDLLQFMDKKKKDDDDS